LWRQKKREEDRRKNKKTEDPIETYHAEVDLCYLERESELRDIRKEKHKVYLATLEPEIDFDEDVDFEEENG
jgi:hypothetical protein